MDSNQSQAVNVDVNEGSNNDEKVVLRALVGNPHRHKPLAQHVPPSTMTSHVSTTPMYTLDARYGPIPSKVLPKSSETIVYHIEKRQEEPRQPNIIETIPIIQREEEPAQSTANEVKTVEENEQEPQPKPFIEPMTVVHPVMYSVVPANKIPVVEKENLIPAVEEVTAPTLYSITGHSHSPIIDKSETVIHETKPTSDTIPCFYSLVARPCIQMLRQPTMDPMLKASRPPSPHLYPIVGSPTFIPQEDHEALPKYIAEKQPTDVHPDKPAPVLYTLVGDTNVPTDIAKENQPPMKKPTKEQTTDATFYLLIGHSDMSQPKIPSQNVQVFKQQSLQQPQSSAPTLYTTVGQPSSPKREASPVQSKPPIPKSKPEVYKDIRSKRNYSSAERQVVSEEVVIEQTVPIFSSKTLNQTKPQEVNIVKSETIFFPMPQAERSPQSKRPLNRSPGKIHHRDFVIPQHDKMELPNYISPYAYHPSKSYYKQTYNPTSLPHVNCYKCGRATRPLPSDSRSQTQGKRPIDQWTPQSLERHPVNTKKRSRLWDFEHRTHTDTEDDDNEQAINQRRRARRRYRPRTPWIPVW